MAIDYLSVIDNYKLVFAFPSVPILCFVRSSQDFILLMGNSLESCDYRKCACWCMLWRVVNISHYFAADNNVSDTSFDEPL